MTIVCVDDYPIMLKGISSNIRQILPGAVIGAFSNASEAPAYLQYAGTIGF